MSSHPPRLRSTIPPRYPNWQRKRIQNPHSEGSNPSRGTLRCLGTSCTDVLGHRSRFWLGLVVAGGVELEGAEEFAVGGGDADVGVFDEDEHGPVGVASAGVSTF